MKILFVQFPSEIVNKIEHQTEGKQEIFLVNDVEVFAWYTKMIIPEIILFNTKGNLTSSIKRSFEHLRKQFVFNKTQIFFIGKLEKEEDILFCIDHQIDHKPISHSTELLTKLISIHEEKNNYSQQATEINVYPDKLSIEINGKEIHLLKKEFLLFQLFYALPNRLISRKDILDFVWDSTIMKSDRTIDVHITQLRKKIENFNIVTIRGQGFRWEKSKTGITLKVDKV